MSAERILRSENLSLANEYEEAVDVKARSRNKDYSAEVFILFNLSMTYDRIEKFLSENIPLKKVSGVSKKIQSSMTSLFSYLKDDVKLVKKFFKTLLADFKREISIDYQRISKIYNIFKTEIDRFIALGNPLKYENDIRQIFKNLKKEIQLFEKNQLLLKDELKKIHFVRCFEFTVNMVNFSMDSFKNNKNSMEILIQLFEEMDNFFECFNNFTKKIQSNINESELDKFDFFEEEMNSILHEFDYLHTHTILEKERALFLEILHLYLSGTGMMKLSRKYSSNLFEESKLTISYLSVFIKMKYSRKLDVLVHRATEVIKKRYKTIISMINDLSNSCTNEAITNTINQFRILQRPSISLENKEVFLTLTRYKYDFNSFDYKFLLKLVSDDTEMFVSPIKHYLEYFENLLDSYIVQLKMSLDDVLEIIDKSRKKLNLGADFVNDNFLIIDIFFGELSYSRITQRRAFNIEELLGFFIYLT